MAKWWIGAWVVLGVACTSGEDDAQGTKEAGVASDASTSATFPTARPGRGTGGAEAGAAESAGLGDASARTSAEAGPMQGEAQSDAGSAGSVPTSSSAPVAVGGGTRDCPVGFQGPNCDSDVDECAMGMHACAADYPCLNAPGGYVCRGQTYDWPVRNRASKTDADPSLQISASGRAVVDSVTGLMWQRERDRTVRPNWQAARDACEALTLDGFTDFRLPTLAELYSLLDYSQLPGLNDGVFSGFAASVQPKATLWTAPVGALSEYPSNAFALAIGVPWLYTQSTADPVAEAFCVRTHAVTAKGRPEDRFHLNSQAATLHDVRTALSWEWSAGDTRFSYGDAKAYCEKLSKDGAQWRLPTVVEIESVAGNADVFGPDAQRTYWTGTQWTEAGVPSHLDATRNAWFRYGLQGDGTASNFGNDGNSTQRGYVRCVHNAK